MSKSLRIFIIFTMLLSFIFILNFSYATDTLETESPENDIATMSEELDEAPLPTDDFLSTDSGINSIERVTSIPEANLGLNNILNIILIAIGILLILFAIAILIRLKQ